MFDGASLVVNADRSVAWALPAWEEKLVVTEWRREGEGWVCAARRTRAPARSVRSRSITP